MTDAVATLPEPLEHELSIEPPEPARPRSVVAVFSHVRRQAELAETTAAFEAVGLPIAVTSVQTDRPRQAANRRNARAAIKLALDHHVRPLGLPGLLLIEDDVTPARTLAAWLAWIEQTEDRPVTLYTPTVEAWYPSRLARVVAGARPASRSEIATINPATLRRWWGSQAVWLPAEWAEIVVRDRRFAAHELTTGPWDTSLRQLIRERGATLGVAVPNVIQHRGPRNLITPTKTPSISACFNPDAPAPTRRS